MRKKKEGTIQAYFHLSIQSGLVCIGKMNLKSDIRIKILNDRYRPIDLYVFKKKKTNKQTNKNKTKKEKHVLVSKSVIKKRNQPPTKNKQTNKQKNKKTKQNNNNKKGNDDLKG